MTVSMPMVADVRERLRMLLPQTRQVLLAGADHSFAVTRPGQVAAALTAFWTWGPGW